MDDPAKTYTEMLRFRSVLDRMYRARGAGAVCFEVARGTRGMHAHWQVVPVRQEKLELVMDVFKVAAHREGLGEFAEKSGKELLQSEDHWGDSYFRVWVSPGAGPQEVKSESEYQGKGKDKEEEEDKWQCLPLPMDKRFDLQFGRKVLAGVIGGESEERVHWKNCIQSINEEKRDAEAFKGAFQPWDFTL